jgi:hypothetical protein
MVIFSQPYQVSDIKILDTYADKKSCVEAVDRAFAIGGPAKSKSSFGCIRFKDVRRLNR